MLLARQSLRYVTKFLRLNRGADSNGEDLRALRTWASMANQQNALTRRPTGQKRPGRTSMRPTSAEPRARGPREARQDTSRDSN
jgi:hypothetical protein